MNAVVALLVALILAIIGGIAYTVYNPRVLERLAIWRGVPLASVDTIMHKALAYLATLTPYQIAHYLAANGIQGIRGNARECPMINYFKTLLPEGYRALTTQVHISISSYAAATYKQYLLPESAAGFVRAFDNGEYEVDFPMLYNKTE